MNILISLWNFVLSNAGVTGLKERRLVVLVSLHWKCTEINRWKRHTKYYIPDLCVYSLKSVSKQQFQALVDKTAAPEKGRNTTFPCHLKLWIWLLVSPWRTENILKYLFLWLILFGTVKSNETDMPARSRSILLGLICLVTVFEFKYWALYT